MRILGKTPNEVNMACRDKPQTKSVYFLWGANSYGQLGVGHQEDTIVPRAVDVPSPIKQITGGGGHTACVAEDGRVYVCGWNKNGQLGLGNHTPSEVVMLKPLPDFRQKVVRVSCGWNHTLCITGDGMIWAWGCNVYRQLGIPSVEKQADSPMAVPIELFNGCKISDIGAGLRHSIALTENGRLYSWGDGKKGQLGQGKQYLALVSVPQCIESLRSVKCTVAVAGAYHSATITDDGALLMWGLNQHGQCAVREPSASISPDKVRVSETNQVLNVFEPLAVQGLPPLSEVHCGWSNTLAITVLRRVYTWGRSDYGQLGYRHEVADSESSLRSFTHVPKEVPELSGIKQAACGSEHTVALSADDRVLTFGWNEHGMCGTGNEENVHVPHCVTLTVDSGQSLPVLVGSGAGHSMVLVTTDSMF